MIGTREAFQSTMICNREMQGSQGVHKLLQIEVIATVLIKAVESRSGSSARGILVERRVGLRGVEVGLCNRSSLLRARACRGGVMRGRSWRLAIVGGRAPKHVGRRLRRRHHGGGGDDRQWGVPVARGDLRRTLLLGRRRGRGSIRRRKVNVTNVAQITHVRRRMHLARVVIILVGISSM